MGRSSGLLWARNVVIRLWSIAEFYVSWWCILGIAEFYGSAHRIAKLYAPVHRRGEVHCSSENYDIVTATSRNYDTAQFRSRLSNSSLNPRRPGIPCIGKLLPSLYMWLFTTSHATHDINEEKSNIYLDSSSRFSFLLSSFKNYSSAILTQRIAENKDQ